MRKLILLLALALLLIPVVGVQAQTVDNVTWTVQYYDNPFLSDPPAIDTTFTGALDFDLGFDSFDATLPNDDFSARFAADVFFASGTYRFSIRADDVVRVSIDEQAIFSTLNGGQTDQVTTIDVPLEGTRKVQVDYVERTGVAFLEVSWQNVASIGQPAPGQPSLTVNVGTLNVRNAPSTQNTQVITQVTGGQSFTIIGRNADASWYQISANGVTGWVTALLVNAVNGAAAPVTSTTTGGGISITTPQDTEFVATTISRLNLRTAPTTDAEVITVIPQGETARVIGRNRVTSWVQVNYNGTVGWVSYFFVTFEPPIVLDQVPITG